jgi:2-dehydro-3-deoxy-L-rhamnonate dehydrogenase (NAD+)
MIRYNFDGRIAIVTGGAGGLGVAIARALLTGGARVILWDVSPEALAAAAAELGEGVTTTCVDITDEASVSKAAHSITGPIHILINNAGILGPVLPSWELEVAAFRRVVDVNLTGTFICNKVIVPLMIAAKVQGRIVNISSIQGKEGMALASAYSASKAGMIALTKTLGKELAGTSILVNAVTPAAAETAMAQEISAERRADILARIPMGRFVTPEEIAAQVLWLASEECAFATGAVFDLSGGRATY